MSNEKVRRTEAYKDARERGQIRQAMTILEDKGRQTDGRTDRKTTHTRAHRERGKEGAIVETMPLPTKAKANEKLKYREEEERTEGEYRGEQKIRENKINKKR